MSGSSPRWARFLLRLLLPVENREFILGDLEEEYETRILTNRRLREARRWYWWVAAQSLCAQWSFQGIRSRRAGNRIARGPKARASLGTTPPHRTPGKDRLPMADVLVQDLRQALRTFAKAPAFTAVVVLTLTLGIGSTVAMFSVLEAALGRGLPFPESHRLVLGRATVNSNLNPMASFPDYLDYRDQASSFESLGAVLAFTVTAVNTGTDTPDEVTASLATREFFSALGTTPFLGRTFTAEEASPGGPVAAVLSYGCWQRVYGSSPDVLTQSLVLDGTPVSIVGVMPPDFRFFFDVDLWLPGFDGGAMTGIRRYTNWYLVGRLRDQVSVQEAQSEVDVISAQLAEAYPDSNTNKGLRLDLLHAALVENYRSVLFLLSGAILMVLLIASGNVAGLLLARGSTRSSEMAMRAALGAGRMRLFRQLLTESLALALGAGVLGVLAAGWLQQLILAFTSMERLGLERIGISPAMLLFALFVSLGAVFLFGLVPALRVSRANPSEQLREGARSSDRRGGLRLRSGLVVTQVALSTVLLLCSGLLVRSYLRLTSVDPGFDTENLLTAGIRLPLAEYADAPTRIQFYESLVESMEALPGVEAVGLADRLPIRSPGNNVRLWDPENPPGVDGPRHWAFQRTVFPGYFGAMDIQLLAGRDFHRSDGNGNVPLIILSKMAADSTFPGQDPLGRQAAVDVGGTEPLLMEVVGVVEDLHLTSLGSRSRLAMYYAYHQGPSPYMELAVRTRTDAESFLQEIQGVLSGLDRQVPLVNPRTMEQVLSGSVSGNRSIMTALGLFSMVAAFLAVLGLYGVLAFFVTRRTHEIGVRVALGAATHTILGMIFRKGMFLASIGLILGVAGTLGTNRILGEYLPLFRTETTDPAAFVGVVILFAAVAAFSSLLPAWRAVRIDPVEAFRAE